MKSDFVAGSFSLFSFSSSPQEMSGNVTGNATAEAIYELLHMSPPEWGVIGLGVGVFSVNLVVLAFVNWNRNYAPLKIKQIPLVTLSMIAGIIWWIGALVFLSFFASLGKLHNGFFFLRLRLGCCPKPTIQSSYSAPSGPCGCS